MNNTGTEPASAVRFLASVLLNAPGVGGVPLLAERHVLHGDHVPFHIRPS